ncbi:MAG: MerR family transcriptional regulator [Leadbetterella sp.]|jgi:DNA-binding transcriptional MerR regulator|nr:MerR family transcriptional regulator [Leadbetterella sp.]
MSQYSIRDLEQLSGIKAHTLRIWEQRYKILVPQRSDTNIRSYSDNELKLLLNISTLKGHGYKISEIAKLKETEIKEEVFSLSDKQMQYSDQIQALTIAMIDIDEQTFENTINKNIQTHGIEKTMVNVIYPFLTKIGILWLSGSIGPSQEHFITNLIRQKIVVEIDKLPTNYEPNAEKVVVYTPEGEYHEIGILFAYYIFKNMGKKVIYLGQSLPFDELKFIIEKEQPNFVFSAFTSFSTPQDVQNYVSKIGTSFHSQTVYLTGMQVVGQKLDLTENIKVINTVQELIDLGNKTKA